MRELVEFRGGCPDQTALKIRFDLSGKLKKLIDSLIDEGFKLWIDDQGNMSGKLEGSYEEISRLRELLKIKGFKS